MPLYHQVYLILRRRILDGELEINRPLPGENRLAGEFGVSRVTIRKSLHNLEQDGFIVKRCGIGSFPVPQAVEFRNRYNIGGLVEADDDPADNARPKTLSIETVSPPARVREKLAGPAEATNVADEQRVLRLTRLRSIRGEPFTIMTAWFSAEHAANIDHRELKKMPPPAALEAIGVALTRAEQWISAKNADETTAPLLQVPVGTALIFMGTAFHDRNEHTVMVMESLYRPDLYEYRSTMRRNRSGKWE
jgi:GntR family transcriptional regulator